MRVTISGNGLLVIPETGEEASTLDSLLSSSRIQDRVVNGFWRPKAAGSDCLAGLAIEFRNKPQEASA